MKKFLMLGGAIAIAFGLLFVEQGLGYIPWPSRSFMINDIAWAYYGSGLSIVGLFLIFLGRRR